MPKTIIITGGSTGIGAATAKKAIENGYNVVATARTEKNLEILKKEINNMQFETFACDVTNYEDLLALKKFVLEKFGQIDIVFANAGYASGARTFLDGNTSEEWKNMVLTNVYGVAITVDVFLSELVKTQGQLIITGSVVGRVTPPGSLYSATKWGVTGMADSIRKEIVGKNVRVTLLEPGVVDTPFWPNGSPQNSLTAEDVANIVIFTTQQPNHVDLSEILVRPTGQPI